MHFMCHMACLLHPTCLDYPNNIGWETRHEAPHGAVVPNLLQLLKRLYLYHPTLEQRVSSMLETKFFSHTKVGTVHYDSVYFNRVPRAVWGMQWRSWLRHCSKSRKVAGRFPMVSLEFFIHVILPAALWPWG